MVGKREKSHGLVFGPRDERSGTTNADFLWPFSNQRDISFHDSKPVCEISRLFYNGRFAAKVFYEYLHAKERRKKEDGLASLIICSKLYLFVDNISRERSNFLFLPSCPRSSCSAESNSLGIEFHTRTT